MQQKKSIQSIRSTYRRKQRMAPLIVGALALVLVVVGGLFLVFTLAGGNKISLFATKTPTPTITPSPTDTPTVTPTPTETLTPTEEATITPIPSETPSGPFTYTVQEGDVLFSIAQKFGLDVNYLMEYNKLTDANIFVGQELIIPLGVEPPTATPLPTYLPKGRVIEIIVKANDSFNGLASQYNTTIEAILQQNEDKFGKIDLKKDKLPALQIGMRLKIPANLVTPTPTTTPQISVRQTQTQAAIQTVMAQPTK